MDKWWEEHKDFQEFKRKSGLALYGSSNVNSWINTPLMAGGHQVNLPLEENVTEYVERRQEAREWGIYQYKAEADKLRELEEEQHLRFTYKYLMGDESE